MNKTSSLINDTVIYAIATIGPKLVSFVFLPLFTSCFSTSEYGEYDVINITISLLIPFISFEILNAVYRWLIVEKDPIKINEIISTGFIFTIRNLILFNLVSVLSLCFIKIQYPILVILVVNIDVISNFIQKCVRGLGRNKLYAGLGILQTLVTVITQIICIFIFKLRIESFFIGLFLGSLTNLILAFYLMRFDKLLSLNMYSKSLVKQFLLYSIPLIPGAISWWIMNASDRYVITFFLGLSANGIYSVANKLPTLVNLLKTIFQLSWQDNAIKNYNEQDRDVFYSKIFKYFYRLSITSCMLLISIIPILMKYLVDFKFYDSWKYTGILCLGVLFSAFSSFWSAAYHGSKSTKIILKTTVLGAIVNVVVNIALIKTIGIYAAAISTLVGYLVMWIASVMTKSNNFKISINGVEFLSLLACVVIVLLLTYINSTVILIFTIIISSLFFYFCNKMIIFKLYRAVMSLGRKLHNIKYIN